MNKAGKIISVNPPFAIPGGEISIECENFRAGYDEESRCLIGESPAQVVAASANRVLAIVPHGLTVSNVEIVLESGGERSEPVNYTIGRMLAEDLHIVANPAVDPKNDSIIVTRSGSRGQQLPVTLFRLEPDGFLGEMSAEVLNPTGIAFNRSGNLFVTNRAEGEVYRINHDEEVVPYASNLGLATAIAFDKDDVMFVGDRSGTIYKVKEYGVSESFAVLEPSVAAYHFAFGANGKLYVTAPGLASFDCIHTIDKDGTEEKTFRGFGRPQGIAFDRDQNLYAAASYKGAQGIVRINTGDEKTEIFVAGKNVVGLCFTRKGEMIVATNDSVYSLPTGIYGTLLS